ncbi:MAG: hypothetical protein Harvfovirus10_32 [Harvfovirus sp.]|uniref:Microbial-type PARG catalytic domain-containing protein n=1 Tax=Harvfovirus sp. TaxID=2487768 RepID=A0A3G5A373_9VIRU|nr:MAG: hypothetical protein Harvfovirus10_32 [Harvfovirus sp.]
MKKYRINIQRDTLKYLEKNKNKFNSVVKRYETNNVIQGKIFNSCVRVGVVGMDTLEAVGYFQEMMKRKFAFLIMANSSNPGGGYKLASPAQEESIARRTNLIPCITSVKYPIPEFGALYIKNISIIRDLETKKYSYLDKPIISDCVLSSAYSNPLIKDGVMEKKYRRNTMIKIRAMFNILLENSNTNIILSAYGCGAYGNDPVDMANIFKEVISEYKYRFENIIFAIVKDQWSKNYSTFNEMFGSFEIASSTK